MKNKNNLPLYIGIALAMGVLIGGFFNFPNVNSTVFGKQGSHQKIQKLLQFIEQEYVDAIDTDELLDNVITDLIGKLDPHSVYFPKDELLANKENLQGNFEGIGVQFSMHNDTLVVTHVLKGGPSEKVGILAGDRILIANQDTLYDKNLSNAAIVKVLKGPSKTKVDLTVYRKGNVDLLAFSLERGKVAIESAEVAYMLTDQLGYLKLDRFAMTSFQELQRQLIQLKTEGATNLILDLRQNGGGYIHVANQIVDQFLTEGKLIVFTENNKGIKEEFFATSNGVFQEGKVYVLIDEGSASASEIVAGALQDNDKGVIVGRRSFGKGLVQEEMNLGDGSAVRLTIARYFTPTGRSIQKPYKMNDAQGYALDYQNRLLNGELLSKDSIKVTDSLKFTTPKGKVVYGGGGIIPDVFVAVDTTLYIENRYFRNISEFTFDYADTHRKEFKDKGFDAFSKDYDQNTNVLDNYIEKNKSASWQLDEKRRQILNYYLKSLIARQVFGEIAFFKVNHKKDNMIAKVLELEGTVVD